MAKLAHPNFALAILAFVGAAVGIVWLAQPTSFLLETLPAQTHSYLALCQRLAVHGSSSIDGVPSSGFQPLFVGLFSVIAWALGLFEDHGSNVAMTAMMAFSLVFHLATLLVALPVFKQLGGAPAVWFFGLFWVLAPPFILAGTNGLETSLATLLFFGIWRLDVRHPITGCRPEFQLYQGTLMGLCILGRFDLGFILVYYAWIIGRGFGSQTLRKTAQAAIMLVVPMFWMLSPFLVFGQAETGQFILEGGDPAKALGGWLTTDTTSRNWHAIDSWTLWTFASLVCVSGVMAGITRVRALQIRTAIGSCKLPMAYGLMVAVFYGVWSSNESLGRNLYPVLVTTLIVTSLLVGLVVHHLSPQTRWPTRGSRT